MKKLELDRRAFLLGAGASLSASLLTDPTSASVLKQDALFASGYKDADGKFGLALLAEDGAIIHTHALPVRGHGVTANQISNWAIVFARRPGNFALAFDPNGHKETQLFTTPNDRHFYGHGVFAANGKILYAAENDFENGIGKIGIYDVTNSFARIGEFNSAGIGPHEIIMLPDQKTLCVANGGIKTHPQFPRTKLNLDSMRSNIAFIDASSGLVKAIQQLPQNWSLLSMRHMAADQDGNVWLGGQYEGSAFDRAPLIGRISIGEELEFVNLPMKTMTGFKDYIGSVTINQNQGLVAFTSPKGGQVLHLDIQTAEVVHSSFKERTCGLASFKDNFISSSDAGRFGNTNHEVYWDNHIGRLR